MRTNNLRTTLKAAVRVLGILSFAALVAYGADVTVNLTAGPATATMPDGTPVPMWGYTCGAVTGNGACAALNTHAAGNWSPVVITVKTGDTLKIALTNHLYFPQTGSATSFIPTSLVIVGQVGGGLGTGSTTVPSPTHAPSYVTWPTVGGAPGDPQFVPPSQGARVQSFSTEVAAASGTGTTTLTWTTPQAGTYLLESGTHPSIQGPMGLYGMVVVTTAPTASSGTETAAGTAYTGIAYDADVPLLLSEIDPVQNKAVNAAVNNASFSELAVWSGQPGQCGDPSSPTYQSCYPPAVNYTPLYYLFNGVAFNRTNASVSLFPASPVTLDATHGTTRSVLVRLVNAGLRMHVPSIVGSRTTPATVPVTTTPVAGFSLVAEDGNLLPGNQRVQSEVFLAAGKTYDVMINAPTSSAAPALAVFDREGSLSANAFTRDAGMLAYIGMNGGGIPSGVSAAAKANADGYSYVVPGKALTVSDPAKGVIANDANVYGVAVFSGPSNGTLVLNPNGTFTYTPGSGWSGDSFKYAANGATTCPALSPLCATVTLSAATSETSSGISHNGHTFYASVAGSIGVTTPGVLAYETDTAGYPLTVDVTSALPSSGLNVYLSANGGFNASLTTPNTGTSPVTSSFTYRAKSSYGTSSSNITILVVFPPPGNLHVSVVDGKDKTTPITDYRWIIEEDRTFYIDPNCRTNPPGPGCPTGIVPTLGVNFHTSDMTFVAQGCTGKTSCEGGQTVYDPAPLCTAPGVPAGCTSTGGTHYNAVCDVGNGVCRPDPTGNGQTPVDPSQVALDYSKRYYVSVLPGDASDPFGGTGTCADSTQTCVGHGMGGAPVPAVASASSPRSVTVLSQPSPYPPSKLSVFVFEDDFPLNGEQDAGGGVDVLAPNEPGLGGFQIHLWDAMGGNGDFTGQMTYDMFNQPLSNSLAGTIDPSNGNDACPISPGSTSTFNGTSVTATKNTLAPVPVGTSPRDVIAITGLTVDPSQIGNTVVIQGGTGFTKGTYTITAVTAADPTHVPPIPGTWTLSPSIPGTFATAASGTVSGMTGSRTQPGITGMIVTCPMYESDRTTLSPLAGQAVIANLMPGRFGVVATPGADRIARGEEWLQTNTLDGQKAHDSFVRIGEPSYFQEFGPAGYHVTIGFANPTIINNRLAGVCNGSDINLPDAGQCAPDNIIKGQVTGERLSRTPDERLYGSGSHDAFYWTQSYVSIGDPDGEDFAFTKAGPDGSFSFSGIPAGTWRVTSFDQWNDQLVDGLSTPVALTLHHTVDMGQIAATQWQTNMQTRTFIDDNKNGVYDAGEGGVTMANVAVRLRDGSLENLNVTDFNGVGTFNETFPLFSWYVVETDVTRYKNTGTHVIYDVGGPADGSPSCGQAGYPPCGHSSAAALLANTSEKVSVPVELRVPGAVYCADDSTHNADCLNYSILNGSSSSGAVSACTSDSTGAISCTRNLSSGRIDPPWVTVEGWQGFPGQFSFIDFGKAPYAAGENGGIQGHVVYASTRPFDEPADQVQLQWEPLVPHVTMNLYQETTAPDGSTALKLVDTTTTTSFDDFAQGFRADGVTPNMSCPGQTSNTGLSPDLFFFSLFDQPNYLNAYNAAHGGTALHSPPLPYDSQFKCYDGMHNWNQVQPVPYDGMYSFPSVVPNNTDTNGMPRSVAYNLAHPTTPGTNCTICIADPATATPANSDPKDPNYDSLRSGLPMLPAGKYVVEVVLPPGYELVKEEDKNILIGDNYIAPVSQQFGGLGNVFIMPDQAAVGASYNRANAQNPTTDLGASPRSNEVPGFLEPLWPCVGQARVVPDYISLFPQSVQVSPFAGATRNLCDRKEVVLNNQMGAVAKFYVFTSTHKASKFTGGITDDFTSEFDPFSPQFGEKFAPPNLPVSIKDWTGAETNRVYADQWGSYNGMTYSSWEVNPPNPTGYAPSMMVVCMNDRGTGTTPDVLFNPGYSQFCYELPFMPGTTQYLDTPVVPTSAFSEGYNHPDCAEPAATPAISKVDGDGLHGGPWVSAASVTLTINALDALGPQKVPNYAYSGPSINTPPYNQQTVVRAYNFGTQCTTANVNPNSATCNTVSKVTIGTNAAGVPITAPIVSWGTNQIKVTVPSGVQNCAVQQQAIYAPGATSTQCGQLTITAGNGLRSVDAVTVTIGGKAPTYVSHTTDLSQTGVGDIQTAIDAAKPGDLLMIQPGVYQEMVVMWKPVRLQGVGAASVIIDANTQPAGKLDPWRAYVSCLFGLARNGQPFTGGNLPSPINTNPFDSTDTFSCGATGATGGSSGTPWYGFSGKLNDPQVDRLPLEGILGWDTTVNGNLAQLLQEPTLMGAYEGAGITVLSKGVKVPSNAATSYYGNGAEAAFPTGTVVLTNSTSDCLNTARTANPYPSNFSCNPSSIDGLTITDASQGGGGIFAHAWAHNLQVANNRIFGNIGTLSGGINIGQGESPDIYSAGTAADSDPGSCRNNPLDPVGLELPYCFDLNVNVHHNAVTLNTSIGDELFSGTPAGAGGVAFCTGADYYKFNYNWVCGNMSTGDGGGVAHIGFIWNGDIEHNTIIFNQSLNPTIATNGGGLLVMGAAPDGFTAGGIECGSTAADADCAPGLPDGTGPGLVINANLIMGNAAESGSGGGLRLQSVNGTEINSFTGSTNGNGSVTIDGKRVPNWNTVEVTNNIITNNIAGWDGGGVSLQDALAVDLINNTIASNDSTATSGVLFNTLGSPLASAPGSTHQCPNTSNPVNCGTVSSPQPGGLVAIGDSPNLRAIFTSAVSCPTGTGTNNPNHAHPNCMSISNPYMANDLFWQNRSFFIGVGELSAAYQQNILALYNASFTSPPAMVQAPNQPPTDATTAHGGGFTITGGTGACTTASYWDIGVRDDTAPGVHSSGITLKPIWSVLTQASEDSTGSNNLVATNPQLLSQYCNGSRIPPEAASIQPHGAGWQVPPGISDATVPNPIFNLTPAATVDEGNNWVNLQWGPLALTNQSDGTNNGNVLGNYALASTSPAVDHIPNTSPTFAIAPTTDFFGNPRPDNHSSVIDIGAVEYQTTTTTAPIASVTGGPLAFGNWWQFGTSPAMTLTLHNTGTADLAVSTLVFSSARFSRPAGAAGGTCTAGLGPFTLTVATGSCTINVVFSPLLTGAVTGTLTINANVAVTGSPVSLSGTGVAPPLSLTPTTHGFGTVARGGTSASFTFTLTNPSALTLTGVGPATLTGLNPNEFTIVPAGTTCGTTLTSLTQNQSCTVVVNFKPLPSPQTTGFKTATVNVADAAGTQSAIVTGTAN